MTTVQDRLLNRVRMDLGDLEKSFEFQFAGDGYRNIFNLEHRPIKSSSILVIRDGQVVNNLEFEGISIDHDDGLMSFIDPPPPDVLWEVRGQQYRYFSDSDLLIFIDTSLAQHGHNRSDSAGLEWTQSDIKAVEEYPISIHAAIQALWALATDAAFDIDILAPDGVNIPRSERYRQLLEMIGARQRQYDELAQALNIGVSAIETMIVRRTAKLTNRLVPVYLPAEYDDTSKPKRVLFPPIMLGTEPVKTGIANYDWHIITGDPASAVLDFAFDITGCVIENAIRRMPTGGWPSNVVGPPVHRFTQTVVDASTGKMRLSLTGQESRWLPYNCYWELQIKKPGEDESRTKMRGLVKVTNNEIVRGSSSTQPVA